jgi:hypothetical protein
MVSLLCHPIVILFLIVDFKSDPNKTTADNISVYLEKKNITNIHQFEAKPKFTTVNTGPQIKPVSEGVININYIPDQNVIKTVNPDLVKDEDASDEDSDLDVFVIIFELIVGGTKSCPS